MADGSRKAVEADNEIVSAAKVRELEKRVRELQRVLGKKTMANEILREAVRLAQKKSSRDCHRCPWTIPREGDRRHARILAIELIDQSSAPHAKRGRYSKTDDDRLIPMIWAFFDDRSTSGYRRITVLLNRKLRSLAHPRVNHKRVYRMMLHAGLLLQRHTGLRRGRAHDGVVRTLRSNMRWCFDGFEIACWNGEVVRVAFIENTCGREIITWAASTRGFSGEMIRDMLLIAVEKRFGAYRAPHRVECLSDNRSCYIAAGTIDFALGLGLMPRFTPVRFAPLGALATGADGHGDKIASRKPRHLNLERVGNDGLNEVAEGPPSQIAVVLCLTPKAFLAITLIMRVRGAVGVKYGSKSDGLEMLTGSSPNVALNLPNCLWK